MTGTQPIKVGCALNKTDYCLKSSKYTTHFLTALTSNFLFSLPYKISNVKPAKTKTVPNHCRGAMAWEKMMTEARMVKNLRVVVMMEHIRGPNVVTVKNTNICKQRRTSYKQNSRVAWLLILWQLLIACNT